MQWISVFTEPNHSGARAKIFWMLEPDLEPKNLDAWS